MCKKIPHNHTAGFSLIEMLVSLALFTIVITIAVGALLSLIATSTQVQGQQNVMTTLTFAMDSMSREIRTGKNYYCAATPFTSDQTSVLDCSGGNNSISFVEAGTSLTGGGNQRISYYLSGGALYRKVGVAAGEKITSNGIEIMSAKFYVTSSSPLSQSATYVRQANVTIFIKARSVDDTAVAREFLLQTTVTQRELDI